VKPALALPLNDPQGLMFPHLRAITPTLKSCFAQAFISVNATTQAAQSEYMAWLATDDFFKVLYHETDRVVGEDFLALYKKAAASCQAEQVIHLCFIDRVAFALQTEHREAFLADIQTLSWKA